MAAKTKTARSKKADPAAEARMAEIDAAAAAYADAHEALSARVAQVEEEVRAVHARHAAAVRELAEAEAARKRELVRAVDRNRTLFTKPKSRSFYGVKVGVRKGQDTLSLGDEDRLIDRIKDLLPEKYGQLVKESFSVVRSAIKTLSEQDLQRLGVRYVAGADEPFASVEKGDAGKAAEAILASAEGVEQ